MPKKIGRPPKEIKEHTPPMQIRVAHERRIPWQRAADLAGIDLSEWIRRVCDKAANRQK